MFPAASIEKRGIRTNHAARFCLQPGPGIRDGTELRVSIKSFPQHDGAPACSLMIVTDHVQSGNTITMDRLVKKDCHQFHRIAARIDFLEPARTPLRPEINRLLFFCCRFQSLSSNSHSLKKSVISASYSTGRTSGIWPCFASGTDHHSLGSSTRS